MTTVGKHSLSASYGSGSGAGLFGSGLDPIQGSLSPPSGRGKVIVTMRPRHIDIDKKLPVIFEELPNDESWSAPTLTTPLKKALRSSVDGNVSIIPANEAAKVAGLDSGDFVLLQLSPQQPIPIPPVRTVEDFEDATPEGYSRPPVYIKYQENLEEELPPDRVDYDMDDDDFEFLDKLNDAVIRRAAEIEAALKAAPPQKKARGRPPRSSTAAGRIPHPLTAEKFEQLMDLLEKENFKQRPVSNSSPPLGSSTTSLSASLSSLSSKRKGRGLTSSTSSIGDDGSQDTGADEESARCAICDDSDYDDQNMIVFCDRCELAVHQLCYGVPQLPDGPWVCRSCSEGAQNAKCRLCSQRGGALKPVESGGWAHILCATWIPETGFRDWNTMEPVINISKVPGERWNLRCYLCKKHEGACIQCRDRFCFAAFHPSCARKHGLLMDIRPGKNNQTVFRALCGQHTKLYQEEKKKGLTDNDAEILERTVNAVRAAMTAATNSHHVTLTNKRYKLGLPQDQVETVFQYWKEKRARHDNKPLIRKLQMRIEQDLEARAVAQKKARKPRVDETDAGLRLVMLRQDLDRTRILLDLVKKREHVKKELLLTRQQIFETIVRSLMPATPGSAGRKRPVHSPSKKAASPGRRSIRGSSTMDSPTSASRLRSQPSPQLASLALSKKEKSYPKGEKKDLSPTVTPTKQTPSKQSPASRKRAKEPRTRRRLIEESKGRGKKDGKVTKKTPEQHQEESDEEPGLIVAEGEEEAGPEVEEEEEMDIDVVNNSDDETEPRGLDLSGE